MKVIENIPFELRLIFLFLLGGALGSLVNLVVDRLRERTPRYSPWNDWLDRWLGRKPAEPHRAPDERGARRKKRRKGKPSQPEKTAGKFALLPIIGWLEVAATAPAGRPRHFWVRPMLVELLMASSVALLYWWEVGRLALIPDEIFHPRMRVPETLQAGLHQQFLLHGLLLTFMLAASLIDLDEWVIPDAIAVTGTLVALVFAAASPSAALFTTAESPERVLRFVMNLSFSAPGDLVPGLAAKQPLGISLALACVWLWCFAQLPRVWRLGRGWRTAVGLFFGRLAKERAAVMRILLIGVLLTIFCFLVWWYSETRWTALLSALIGMTVGGCLIWTIRVVCSAILRREAMGFGDVTLMAMIGAFLGWQPTLFAFFLSPFFGLIPPIIALTMRSGAPRAVPYGPFLCLGAMTVVLLWAKIWPWMAERLEIFVGQGGGLVLVIVASFVAALVLLLWVLQMIKRLVVGRR